jgi:cobalt-zinc-cadmium efflux system membrane fusion protein
VLQRKAGPGQFIVAGATDPVFLIGDTGTVWLAAFVREADAQKVAVGQTIRFSVLAEPEQQREAKIAYVATNLDPTSRRLMVRAVIDNADGRLKPEMFANAGIFVGSAAPSLAIPKDAVIYEGSATRVWTASGDRALSVRKIQVGLAQGGLLQVTGGLNPDDSVITRGSLFIDRAASSN